MQMKTLEHIKPQMNPPKQCKRNEHRKTTNLTAKREDSQSSTNEMQWRQEQTANN